MADAQISVVIATLASPDRADMLRRAIASVANQTVPCDIIVVVNGHVYSTTLVDELHNMKDVDVLRLDEGDLPRAWTIGVDAVRTPYYCFLDDDDVLMPYASSERLDFMNDHPVVDLLVTSGEKQFSDGSVGPLPEGFDSDRPLSSLLDRNWLASCGGVFRAATVGPDYFAQLPRFLEWTYLAFRVVQERDVAFLMNNSRPHFRVHETAASESASDPYILAQPAILKRMHEEAQSAETRKHLSRKRGVAAHHAAIVCARAGRWKDAWNFHWESLGQPNGFKFIGTTRFLVFRRRPD